MHQLMAVGAPSIGSVLGAAKSCMEPHAARQAATLLLCTNDGIGACSELRSGSQLCPAEGKCKNAMAVVAYKTIPPRLAIQCFQCRADQVCAGSSADTTKI